MTLEEFYKIIDGMPKDTPIKAIIKSKEYHSLVINEPIVKKEFGMLIITNKGKTNG